MTEFKPTRYEVREVKQLGRLCEQMAGYQLPDADAYAESYSMAAFALAALVAERGRNAGGQA